MDNKYKKILIITTVILFVLSIVVYLIVTLVNSRTTITVDYDDKKISSVELILLTGGGESYDEKTILDSIKPSKVYNIPKLKEDGIKQHYIVKYKGTEDYADSSIIISDDNEVNIKLKIEPELSEKKLNQLVDKDIDEINQAITNEFANIHKYTIERGYIYKDTKWYYTTLTYNNRSSPYSDTLRVVLKNEDGKWKVVTRPDIVLMKKDNPDVPTEVLSWANNHESGLTF